MKKLFPVVLVTLAAVLTVSDVSAQSMGQTYRTALGVKFYPMSLSLKHFTNSNSKAAIEGLGYFYTYGFRLTGLYEIHGDISGAPGLKWYIGPGAHVGFWNTKYKDRYNNDGAYFGVDGVLGLDYKFTNAPINISLDWQPSWTFGSDGRTGFDGGWGGFGIRYTF
jgi:hypothetical protein